MDGKWWDERLGARGIHRNSGLWSTPTMTPLTELRLRSFEHNEAEGEGMLFVRSVERAFHFQPVRRVDHRE